MMMVWTTANNVTEGHYIHTERRRAPSRTWQHGLISAGHVWSVSGVIEKQERAFGLSDNSCPFFLWYIWPA